MSPRSFILCIALTSLAEPLVAGEGLTEHGGEQVVRVKRQSQSFYKVSPSGAWVIQVQGPAKIAVGLRLVGRKPKLAATLSASVDGGPAGETACQAGREPAARIAGAPGTVSREVAVVYEVPGGAHRLELRLLSKQASGAVLRLLDKAPPGAVVATALSPPPSAASTKLPAAASAATPPSPAPPSSIIVASAPALALIHEPAPATQSAPPPTGEVILAASVDAPGASSAPSTQSAAESQGIGLTVGIEGGVGFPQILSELSTGLTGYLELGWRLPLLEQRIEAQVTAGYHQAVRRASATDARLAAGESFDFTLIERQVIVTAGGVYRVLPPSSRLNGYALLAARLDLQRSEDKGSASGAGFGKNVETSTAGGMVVGGGFEYRLGPGALAAEVSFAWSGLDQRVTGDSAAGGIALHLGYHAMF